MLIQLNNSQQFVSIKNRHIKNIVKKVLNEESKKVISNRLSVIGKNAHYPSPFISITFIDNKKIKSLNKKYLGKNRPTDVIAFNLSDSEDELIGDIYISTEQAIISAKEYNVSVNQEIDRLVIHGVLHILGYKDKSKKDSKIMREKEDYYLYK